MADNIREPLVPPDVDLRNYGYMPLDVVRLRDAEVTVTLTGDEFRAAILLWCACWHQVPASSLPNDDRSLARYAGYGRDVDGWKSVKSGALYGFVECSDGRLYHSVIAAKALEAYNKKRNQRARTEKATASRHILRNGERNVQRNDERNVVRNVVRNVDVTLNVTESKGEERKGEEDKKDSRLIADAISERPNKKTTKEKPNDEKFEQFWRTYPRRKGPNPKVAARTKFQAIVRSGTDPAEIIAAASRCADEARKEGQEGTRFIPQAITWLNQQRWVDYSNLEVDEKLAAERGLVRLTPETPQWEAWERFKGGSIPRDKTGGWLFPHEWPPGHKNVEISP